MTERTYSGDVTLEGTERPPVALRDAEDVYVKHAAVDGGLEIVDAEYVFTFSAPDADVSVGDPESVVAGDLEDGYLDTGGVTGDATVEGAEDVFVEHDAAGDGVAVSGAENVYTADTGDRPTYAPDEYDVSLTGWEQSGRAGTASRGVYVTGARGEVTVDAVDDDVEIYVTGYDHEIEVAGRGHTVSIYFLGRDNTVSVGPFLDAEVVAEAGFDNTLDAAPFPPEALIETSKDEAFSNAGFGRKRVTYQVPAEGEEWCPNCGANADAVIERRQRDAFFVFGHPVWTYQRSTNPSNECEHCSDYAPEVELTEEERREVLR